MKRRYLLKKKNAAGSLVDCIITVVILMAVIVYSIKMYSNLDLAIEKKRIERSFIMQMETEGCLSQAAKDALIQELTELGVEQISFQGTTMSQVGYGSKVVLSVTGRIKIDNIIGMRSLYEFIRGDSTNEFRIYQTSTAKY